MKTWLKNSKKLMAGFGAIAVMLVAGWQFGVGGPEAVSTETKVALEKAIERSGSDNGHCCPQINSTCILPSGGGFSDSRYTFLSGCI